MMMALEDMTPAGFCTERRRERKHGGWGGRKVVFGPDQGRASSGGVQESTTHHGWVFLLSVIQVVFPAVLWYDFNAKQTNHD